jgi:hypothetical protein
MRTLTLPTGPRVLLYSSIFELPAGRHAEFNHWVVRGAGIGSGPGDIDRHFAKVSAFLAAAAAAKSNEVEALLEKSSDALALLHYAFNDTLQRFNPRHLAFGVLVAAVDDKPCADFTEAGLTALVATLDEYGLTAELVTAEVEDVKKNSRRS